MPSVQDQQDIQQQFMGQGESKANPLITQIRGTKQAHQKD